MKKLWVDNLEEWFFSELWYPRESNNRAKLISPLTHTDFQNRKAVAEDLPVDFRHGFTMDPGSLYTQVSFFLSYVKCRRNILSQLALVLHFCFFYSLKITFGL